jgi:predicted nucleic acid-binding protein
LARYFLDSSALVKRYHREVGTPKILSMFNDLEGQIGISSLAVVEVQSAFAAKVRSNSITSQQANLLRARLMADIATGQIEVFGLGTYHLEIAGRLIQQHAFRLRLRTLDAIQLAVALDLRDQNLLGTFVVADRVLGEVAAIEDLPVLNPEIE